MGFQNLVCNLLNDRPNFLTVFARHQKNRVDVHARWVAGHVIWIGSLKLFYTSQ